MTTSTNSRIEQHLEEEYSNTRPVISKAGESKRERCRQAKVAAAGGKANTNDNIAYSKTEQHLEKGYSNTRPVRSEAGDSERETLAGQGRRCGLKPIEMITSTNSKTEKHLEVRYSNTQPVRSEA